MWKFDKWTPNYKQFRRVKNICYCIKKVFYKVINIYKYYKNKRKKSNKIIEEFGDQSKDLNE